MLGFRLSKDHFSGIKVSLLVIIVDSGIPSDASVPVEFPIALLLSFDDMICGLSLSTRPSL